MNLKYYVICFLHIFGYLHLAGQDQRVDQPEENFEALWKSFDDHYAFFELKHVNWNESYQTYRRQINSATSNDSLFAVCCRMLAELKDGHVLLINKDKEFSAGVPANFLSNSLDSILQLISVADSDLVKLGFSDQTQFTGIVGGNQINVTELSNSAAYGYIRVNSMYGIMKRRLTRILNTASERFFPLKGVIIDVRFNGGGLDDFAYSIAARFTDKKRVGHYKCARKKSGHNEFSRLQTFYLKPKGKKQYTGPIILLTSRISASATDVFAMAMRQLPYVTIVGDTTCGVFSDMYESKLYNGWVYTLSNEKYFDAKMNCHEGIGIVPDLVLRNSGNNIRQKNDPLIYKALEILHQKETK